MAIFARLDVLGFQRLEYELTPDAINVALPARMELDCQMAEFGRGERISADTFQLSIRIVGVGGPSNIHRSAQIA